MQDRELKTITTSLNRLRLVRENINKEFDDKEKRLLNRLAILTNVDLAADNQVNLEPGSDNESVPDLETIVSSVFAPTPVLSFDASAAYHQAPLPTLSPYRPYTSTRAFVVGDRITITNRLSHVKDRPASEADRKGTVTKINLVHVRILTDSGIETSRIRKNLERIN